MRDDIRKLDMPASAKVYARRRGLRATLPGAGQRQFVKMVADLTNRGRARGFANRNAGVQEAARQVVERMLSDV